MPNIQKKKGKQIKFRVDEFFNKNTTAVYYELNWRGKKRSDLSMRREIHATAWKQAWQYDKSLLHSIIHYSNDPKSCTRTVIDKSGAKKTRALTDASPSWVRALDERGHMNARATGGSKNAGGKLSTNQILTMDMILKRTEAASDKSDEAGLV